jgi:hypothetical protein
MGASHWFSAKWKTGLPLLGMMTLCAFGIWSMELPLIFSVEMERIASRFVLQKMLI